MINEANKILSVYTGDTSGVCSALYELDGMSVMHDASGCNSTYNTHDEPRWYDIPSRVYLSGITEYEAILGDEEKFINDVVQTAKEQKPKFIAIAATPIPYLMNQDLKSIAKIIEKKSNITTFSVETNGMNSYITGASLALLEWAKLFVNKEKYKKENSVKSINIIGATPLDFANYSIIDSIVKSVENMGFCVNSVWSMGPLTKNMENSNRADYNLVISSVGIKVAKYLKEEFDIPYITALPFGKKQTEKIKKSFLEGVPFKNEVSKSKMQIAIIGEGVYSKSIKNLIGEGDVISLLPDSEKVLEEDDFLVKGEEELENKLNSYSIVIGDPIFKHLVSKKTKFIEVPHFAFSGRMYKNQNPNLVENSGDMWKKELM
ncbi:MAG: nitrogenase component 1 [Pleomorphochaeta sp.]